MQIPNQAVSLRIFIGESDHFDGKPLYEAIVMTARERHLAGATVLRGPMGFGKSSRLHTSKILRLSEDLPLLIILDGMMSSGLIALERVQVLQYGEKAAR